ncbi:MAG TPA: ATP-binding protein [Acidobacteriota bacterium]|nr:ATP-binding protein [Acidobacteriota bacterium]
MSDLTVIVSELDCAPCGWLSVTDDGCVVNVNETLANLLGQAKSHIVGQNLSGFLTVGSRVFYQTHLFPQLKLAGRLDEIYLDLRSANGDTLPMLINAVRTERQGEPANDFILLLIQRREKFESQILQSKRAAEAAAQAAQVANTQLIEMQKELEANHLKLLELDELKTRFTAMLVHDLKSPLTVVNMALQLVQEQHRNPTEHLAEMLDVSKKNIQKIVKMVNQMLDVYRGESRETKVNRLELDPMALLSDCVESARLAAPPQMTITCTVRNKLPALWADGLQLERVFSNLLSNAIKFTPPDGKISVEAWTQAGVGVETGQTLVLISITDTGEGIPAESIPFLFDPYWQANSTHTKPGVGLGLSIVKRIVAAHGGNISVRSQLGIGTCFTVVLPVVPFEPSLPVAAIPVVASLPESSGLLSESPCILVADDEPVNLKVVSILLKRYGYVVDVVSDGCEAVTAAMRKPYDLILMDCQMGKMGGIEAANLIRQEEGRTRHTPIIACTASDIFEMTPLIGSTFDDVLAKPFTPEGLQHLLHKYGVQPVKSV